jgi:hypothetical protein
MRRLAGATVTVLALATSASVSAAPASARTLYNDCMRHLRFAPRSIDVLCGGGLQLRHLRWSSWGAAEARARGRTPRSRVKVLLRRPNACPDGTHVFTRLRITFLDRRWFGHRRFTQSTICPGTG